MHVHAQMRHTGKNQPGPCRCLGAWMGPCVIPSCGPAETVAELLQLAAAQTLANQTQKLKGDIAAYEALGTTQEIRGRLSKLDKIEADAAAKKKKAQDAAKNKPKPNTPKPGAEVGSVASFDPKFGFAVLNRGASHGIKVGDVFRVTRNGQLGARLQSKKPTPRRLSPTPSNNSPASLSRQATNS